ncbi:hypothetical protein PA7_15110 [Pseudonocardia asaccharolytica DSM 44247 = NBRC 16224]|uniref:Uncharacterized protein n=1 Tax=Pseudonocardia asaccharolytica DSM 44247 = NBRC 16224 TaxID=1123024 RepID=A0A511D289_9PSEU|nr:hypothetical protein PA7_15110 [Pseudonocardia asaccharolytica DSM 44247 = NBRC 16224]
MSTQRCPRCTHQLPLAAFPERHRGKPGNYCTDCARDYRRQWKTWSPAARRERTSTTCTVAGCGKRIRAGRAYCAPHQQRADKYGDPHGSRPVSTSYQAVHKRLRRTKGAASIYPCATGCGRQARDWAYDHGDRGALVAQWYGKTVRYSTDPEHYRPLCGSCHTKSDRVNGYAAQPSDPEPRPLHWWL